MRRLIVLTVLAVGFVGLALAAEAQTSPPKQPVGAAAPPASAAPALPFEKYSLENGLTVILHRDPSLPSVAVEVWYRVGPVNEPPGRSGFAHLFEQFVELASDVTRPLEHEVLEKVCEAAASGRLVHRTDAVPDLDRDAR